MKTTSKYIITALLIFSMAPMVAMEKKNEQNEQPNNQAIKLLFEAMSLQLNTLFSTDKKEEAKSILSNASKSLLSLLLLETSKTFKDGLNTKISVLKKMDALRNLTVKELLIRWAMIASDANSLGFTGFSDKEKKYFHHFNDLHGRETNPLTSCLIAIFTNNTDKPLDTIQKKHNLEKDLNAIESAFEKLFLQYLEDGFPTYEKIFEQKSITTDASKNILAFYLQEIAKNRLEKKKKELSTLTEQELGNIKDLLHQRWGVFTRVTTALGFTGFSDKEKKYCDYLVALDKEGLKTLSKNPLLFLAPDAQLKKLNKIKEKYNYEKELKSVKDNFDKLFFTLVKTKKITYKPLFEKQ